MAKSKAEKEVDAVVRDAEMSASERFWDFWQGKIVRVKHGPFVGAEGVAQGTYAPRVQVAFPSVVHSTLWLNADDLEVLNG